MIKNNIMGHLVAGYPSLETSEALLYGLKQAGVVAVEVQIPCSDPIADGETIMHANDVALQNKITAQSVFQLIAQTRLQGMDVPVYVMCYANTVHAFGYKAFCKKAVQAGVVGLIIPDLPFDTPDYRLLRAQSLQRGLTLVPVVSPGITESRLRSSLQDAPSLVYVTSRRGITGGNTKISNELTGLIAKIRALSRCKVAVGFGIRDVQSVRQVIVYADIAVVGSAIVDELNGGGVNAATKFVSRLVSGSK